MLCQMFRGFKSAQMSAYKYYKRHAYVELISSNSVRLTNLFAQKTHTLFDGYNYFNLISLTRINAVKDEIKCIANNKFVLRINKDNLDAGGIVFSYDAHRGPQDMGYVAVGSAYENMYPTEKRYEAKIDYD
jgi:hypothetical protein